MLVCVFLSQVLDSNKFMYAVSQGAMAVECRANDRKTIDLLARISDGPTLLRCVAERAMLKKLVCTFIHRKIFHDSLVSDCTYLSIYSRLNCVLYRREDVMCLLPSALK
jgi:hypothetical protein